MEGFGVLVWLFYLVLFLIVGAIVFSLVYLITMFFFLGKDQRPDTSSKGKFNILVKVLLVSLPITGMIMLLLYWLTI